MVELWNVIRDFIVQNITGGILSNGQRSLNGMLGALWYVKGDEGEIFYTGNTLFDLGNTGYQISMGDWLATTLTIISLVFILVACVMFVVKIIKLVGNLVK